MVNLNIIINQVYNWVNESDTDFNLHFGENKLYLVVEWIDGKSLFMENYFYSDFMNELVAAYCNLDEDTLVDGRLHVEEKVIWFNKLFGIGSEYHAIADARWADDACDTESADLNKMEKERYI